MVWTGVGNERGATFAMKTIRLADINTDKRDECRVFLVEEILTVRAVSRRNCSTTRTATTERSQEDDNKPKKGLFFPLALCPYVFSPTYFDAVHLQQK